MKKDLEVLKIREVPSRLDSRILTAARLAASGNIRKNRQKRIILISGSIAAACLAGFAVFLAPHNTRNTRFEVQYHALNDLSFIEQEAFALASELDAHSVYALDNGTAWENM